MVSDVSAIDVASTTLRRPGRRRHGGVLGAAVHRGVERRDLGAGRQRAGGEPLGDAADLGLPRQEGEDRAGFLRQRPPDGASDGVLDALVGITAEIAGLDREGAASRFDHRSVVEKPGDAGAVERRRHDHDAQVRPQCAGVEGEREAEVCAQRAFVEFVEQHRGDAVQAGIVEDRANEHALGDHLDARAAGAAALETRLEPDGAAQRLAQRRRHPLRRRACRQPARLDDDEAPGLRPGLVEQRERQPRGLAGTRRGDEHQLRARGERGADGGEDVVDGEGHRRNARKPTPCRRTAASHVFDTPGWNHAPPFCVAMRRAATCLQDSW